MAPVDTSYDPRPPVGRHGHAHKIALGLVRAIARVALHGTVNVIVSLYGSSNLARKNHGHENQQTQRVPYTGDGPGEADHPGQHVVPQPHHDEQLHHDEYDHGHQSHNDRAALRRATSETLLSGIVQHV